MKLPMGLMACLIGISALADPGWQSPYSHLSASEKRAMHDGAVDAEERWIGSRYWWIEAVEEHLRPVLQTDEALWKKVEIMCKVCSPGVLAKQRLFDRLKQERDEGNRRADEVIANIIADETGHYRRQLAKDNAESRRDARATLELAKLELARLDAILETRRLGENHQ